MRRSATVLVTAVLALTLIVSCSLKRSDDAIATDVKAQLYSDQQLQGTLPTVAVSKGVVTLSGALPSDSARLEAYKVASNIRGVSSVVDQMTVQTAPPPTQELSPTPAPSSPTPAPKPSRPAKTRRSDDDSMSTPALSAPPTVEVPTSPPPSVVAAAPPPPLLPPPSPPPPKPKAVTIPSGSIITVRMIDAVDSSINRSGQSFHASLDAPIVVGNDVVIPKGADALLDLTNASSAGHYTGKSELHLELASITYQGKTYPISSSTYSVSGSSRGKNSAAKIGGGAAVGALLGGILGGGKGAAIGAGAGGGGGAIYQGATKGQQVKVPAETRLDFTLANPQTISYLPPKNSSGSSDSPAGNSNSPSGNTDSSQ
jgi:hypothetical protein